MFPSHDRVGMTEAEAVQSKLSEVEALGEGVYSTQALDDGTIIVPADLGLDNETSKFISTGISNVISKLYPDKKAKVVYVDSKASSQAQEIFRRGQGDDFQVNGFQTIDADGNPVIFLDASLLAQNKDAAAIVVEEIIHGSTVSQYIQSIDSVSRKELIDGLYSLAKDEVKNAATQKMKDELILRRDELGITQDNTTIEAMSAEEIIDLAKDHSIISGS